MMRADKNRRAESQKKEKYVNTWARSEDKVRVN